MPDKPSIATILTVGEVAQRSGVAVSTLHFYEARGLIHSWRNRGNQRRYPREVLRRVAVIKVAQRAGIPLAGIREALATLPDGRTPTAEDWKKLSTSWRAELDRRIARLTGLRDQLDGCIGCGCLSIGMCPLRNPWDKLAAEGPGPRLLQPGRPLTRDREPDPAATANLSRKADEVCGSADIRIGGRLPQGGQSDGDRTNPRNSRSRAAGRHRKGQR